MKAGRVIVATIEGDLRVHGEFRVPHAEAGTWSVQRTAKLMDLIEDYVAAAEMVDAADYRSIAAHPLGLETKDFKDEILRRSGPR